MPGVRRSSDVYLQRCGASFFVANTNRVVDLRQEYLAITNLARTSGAHDSGHGLLHQFVGEDYFELHLRQKVDRVFTSAVELGVALLTAMSTDFENGHAVNANF